ncbi:MAG: 16S rRNA (adenine(1518)-N(6)/adenine(1519)-N(6))-dimethyltransferase RsmA [Candidatus Eremiobacteraeota bacterium]|nr:16S rRNA (adenine(1518)-N(6)/adenine(1519)-N(6))-dimethyltransferase RsmA [Candidatus Eremiobacteraeota bacterium]
MDTGDSQAHPRALLQARGLRPKKKYGQNFLIDGTAARRIAKLAAGATPEHARIIEIGAGTGALTAALVEEGVALTAIEIDPELIHILASRNDCATVSILCADALAFDYTSYASHGPWRVTGNLPYNIATPLIIGFCEMENAPEALTVMIQKDVADRLAAQPATRAYGSLSIAVQYAMSVERVFTLGPKAFYPAPNVHSTVVQLVRRPAPPVQPADLALFRSIVRAAFAYRRKTLANSLLLALGIDRERLARALRESQLSSMARGEELSMEDFARISDALAET